MQVDLLKSLLEEFRPDSRYDKTSGKQKIEWTLSEANGDVKTITVIKDKVMAARVCDLLTKFKSLQSLTFKKIDLTAVSFAKVCAVDSLRSLQLVHSYSADTPFALPPAAFQGMAKLESLELGNVASAGLEEIAELKALKCLAIHKSDFQAIPPSISALRSLKKLNLSNNGITGGLEHLAQLTELEELRASGNKFSGPIPPSISALRSLKKLDLSHNEITGGLEHLAQLTQLEEVNLYNNKISGPIPSELGQLRKLKRLELGFNLLSGSMPVSLHGVVALKGLNTQLGNQVFGFSLGPNPVDACFFERIVDDHQSAAQKINALVNFADWSPARYCEDLQKLDDESLLFYPHMLIKSPKQIMKQIVRPVMVAKRIFPALRMFLRKLCEAQNPCVLNALARLWYAFTYAAKKHPAEEDELLSFADKIAAITTQLFKCRTLDDAATFYRLVLPKQYIVTLNFSTEVFRQNYLWSTMHVFEEGTPIKLCMDCEFKLVLASPAVANIMEYLFYYGIDFSVTYEDEVGFLCPRYTPVVLFLLEGLSKAVVLLLVISVTIGVYGSDGHTAFANSTAEGFLLLMLFTQLCYEVGQVTSVNWSVKKHFSDIWNGLDAAALALIAAWALLCCFPSQFDVARTLLSLSAIPLSLLMLQYISLVKEIGLLVLMIKSMIVDVMVFVLVYVVSIFGFGVCFYGLFYGESSFHSSGATLLYLFQSTLGNFDFDALSDSKYTGIGTAVLVVFLVLTSVLLVNLLIAQMSSTYSRIKDKSREEWSYIMASYVHEFILLRERTPLCMLPPPLNAITAALAPLHYWALPRYKISIAGTVADYVLGIVLVPFYPVLAFLYLCRQDKIDDGWEVFCVVFSVTFKALVRIFYVIVHVVPAPKPNVPPTNVHQQQFDIWYDVYMQQEEVKITNPSPSPAEVGDGDEGSGTNSTDGVQLQNFPTTSAGQQSATVSALHDVEGAKPDLPNPAPPPTEVETASVSSPTIKEDHPVVLYSEEDIRRMFPDDADDIPSTTNNANTAACVETALEEVKAQNVRLQAEVAEMKAAQEQSNATQAEMKAEMKAAQAEILALVKTILNK